MTLPATDPTQAPVTVTIPADAPPPVECGCGHDHGDQLPMSNTPGAAPLRARIERASAPVLIMLHQLPRAAVGLALLILFALGVVLPAAAGVFFLAIAFVALSWLAYLSWPVVPTQAKVLRIITLAALVAVAIWRLAGN